MNLFQVRAYVKYLLKARYKKGYGLHSPFVFNLVREVIYSNHQFYAFKKIDHYRKKLALSNEIIEMVDFGEGSKIFADNKRKISQLVKSSSIAPKYGEMLFRLIHFLNPESILELGTSIGISTAYFALSDLRRKVYSIEGCPNTVKVASRTFDELKCRNVHQVVGHFKDALPEIVASHETLDFIFFDGHHQKQATLDYFQACLSKAGNNSLFVFDDIHWSKGMEEAWEIICSHPRITVSVDLFQIGLVFFRSECQKQHFVVKY